MRFALAVVGKPRSQALGDAIREFEARAARYWPLEVREVRDEPAGKSGADVVRRREGERLRATVDGMRVVACDVTGERMSSTEFSKWMQDAREQARDVAFLIGGAFGLDEAVTRDAFLRLSLAPWTLPHELARLVLAEQLYRAGTIVRREPYHK